MCGCVRESVRARTCVLVGRKASESAWDHSRAFRKAGSACPCVITKKHTRLSSDAWTCTSGLHGRCQQSPRGTALIRNMERSTPSEPHKIKNRHFLKGPFFFFFFKLG